MGFDVKKKILTFLISTTIVACGGGGSGDSSSSTSEGISLSTNLNETITLSESSSITVPLTIEYSKSDQLDYQLMVRVDGIETNAAQYESELTWEVKDDELHVSVNDIQNTGSTVFILTASHDQKEKSINITIDLENSDLTELQEKAEYYLNSYASIVVSDESSAIEDAYVKVLDILQVDTSQVTYETSNTTLVEALEGLSSALNDSGSSDYEENLNNAVTLFEEAVNEIVNVQLSNINKLADLSDSLTSLPELKLSYIGDSETSFFIGNEHYGEDQNGAFTFYSDYQFIEKFVSPFLKQCEA